MSVLIIAEPLADHTPHQVCNAVSAALRAENITQVPITLGGSGTAYCFQGVEITLPTVTPSGKLTEATYVFDEANAQAYIDVSDDICDPHTADTYGTGVLIADAISRGAERIVLATAGIHTRDGGTGILIALGAQPLNASGLPVQPGQRGLSAITDIDTAQLNIPAACAEWVLLIDAAPQPSSPNFAAFCGLPEDQGIAVGITWLSKLMHTNTDHVHVLPALPTLLNSLGVPELLQTHTKVILATAPNSPTLSLLQHLGASNIETITIGAGESMEEKIQAHFST
ncbi:glycerate kinase [Corynebacterium freiburgense]|uniref:glycerate kinase n=1 Tax=Corynebacterium freiburgense TaxID=556548 RepID=UPI0003FB5661|nr:glycerate kinase [Corynebacterium freiburgense]WJZ03068.1 Glycerate 2-kinase [Corynebacterium freiburgense]